ncbi:MAG: 3-isopropylmalate dehydratase large subunit [Deltaproteobacteria bacterium]|nr:3-isopropylmalate dehydratase large subunit [Deltaproteobacteria bacterium]
MGMTISEKILARHAGLSEVSPGQLINARVDIALGNDVTAPIAIDEFRKAGGKEVFDKQKVVLVPDHFAPNKDIASAEQCKIMRDFAHEQALDHYYEIGAAGVEHALLPEQGIVGPGDLVIGADSHTCTYGAIGAFATGVGSTDLAAAMLTGELWFKVPETMKFVYHGKRKPWVTGKDLILYTIGKIGVDGALYRSMEFTGETVSGLTQTDRLTMANMAIEAGGKNGIFIPDAVTEAYVKGRTERPYEFYTSDPDARYHSVIDIDVEKIELQVSFPHLPSNARGISAVGDVRIDQAIIGSCTNGLIEDLRVAAGILKGRRVAKGVRLIVIPATQMVYRQAMKEGLFDIFLDAGGAISLPTCGPCLGGFMGVLAKGERAVATTNRNFVGRMGHPGSEVYLANPAVAAASAIAGRLAGPDQL